MIRQGLKHLGRLAFIALACTVLLNAPAVAQVNPYNSIALEWTAGGDDAVVGRASSYDLRYAPSDPALAVDLDSWFQAARRASGLPVPSMSGATDSTRVTGLTPDTRYWFVLRAYDDAGNVSPYSNIADARTYACVAPTAAPGTLSATAEGRGVLLEWAAVSDPSATSLHLYRRTGSGSETLLATLAPSATNYTDTSVSPGRSYSYRVAYASACADGPSTDWATLTAPGSDGDIASVHAFPNPASRAGTVNVAFHVPGVLDAPVSLHLYDINGRLIANLVDGPYPPGDHTETWGGIGRGGNRVAPGLYEIVGTVGPAHVRGHLLLKP